MPISDGEWTRTDSIISSIVVMFGIVLTLAMIAICIIHCS